MPRTPHDLFGSAEKANLSFMTCTVPETVSYVYILTAVRIHVDGTPPHRTRRFRLLRHLKEVRDVCLKGIASRYATKDAICDSLLQGHCAVSDYVTVSSRITIKIKAKLALLTRFCIGTRSVIVKMPLQDDSRITTIASAIQTRQSAVLIESVLFILSDSTHVQLRGLTDLSAGWRSCRM